MLLYGTKNTNLSYHPENTWQVVNSEINSSLHRIDLSDFSKPIALEPLPAPGMLVGAKQFFLGSTEAKLFMESRDSAIDFFRPWARSMDTQEFGRSLTACAFDGTNLFFLDEMKVENSHLGISVMNDLLLVPQEKAKGYGLQTFTLDKSGLFQEQNQWFKEKQLIDYAIFQSMVLARTGFTRYSFSI